MLPCTVNAGVRTSWAKFWGKVAQEFASNPNILGYELINEPWAGEHRQTPLNKLCTYLAGVLLNVISALPGDIYADIGLLVPDVADIKNLAPAYEVVNLAAIAH